MSPVAFYTLKYSSVTFLCASFVLLFFWSAELRRNGMTKGSIPWALNIPQLSSPPQINSSPSTVSTHSHTSSSNNRVLLVETAAAELHVQYATTTDKQKDRQTDRHQFTHIHFRIFSAGILMDMLLLAFLIVTIRTIHALFLLHLFIHMPRKPTSSTLLSHLFCPFLD